MQKTASRTVLRDRTELVVRSSHVVRDVHRIESVTEETVAQMHPLFLAAGVYRDDAGVDDDDDSDDKVVFLEYDVRGERYDVESLVLASVELDNDDEKIGPREHGTAQWKSSVTEPSTAAFIRIYFCSKKEKIDINNMKIFIIYVPNLIDVSVEFLRIIFNFETFFW